MTIQTDKKTALVTGVSSGIGRAIAEALIKDGWHVYGSVRKQQDAEAAKTALGDGFTPTLFDVTDAEAIARAADEISAALGERTLNGLVNNAGVAVAGPIGHIPIDDIKRQFDINVYGPIRVIQAFLPLLGADKTRQGPKGKIINMSSVAGKIATPFMSPYAMSKHALEAMTDALRRELKLYGIDAVSVGPGAVKTPIWAKADDINIDQYKDTDFYPYLNGMKKNMQAVGDEGLPPEDVGTLVRDILTGAKGATRYAILNGRLTNWVLPRLLPKRMIDNAIAQRFGLIKK